MPAEADHARAERGLWLFLIVLELLLVTGPFAVAQLHLAYCDWQNLPPPARLAYVPWMMGSGLVLIALSALYALFRRLARLISNRV